MIQGAHLVLYARDPAAARRFFEDTLGLTSVDAGGGWLIFALPPAELACHPAQHGGTAELFLMCTDFDQTTTQLKDAGVQVGPVTQERWGRLARIEVPGFGPLGLYEPRHASPLAGFKE